MTDIRPAPASLPGTVDLRRRRVHPAWWAAGVTFLALLGAAGFRSVPGLFIEPLHAEFGWSVGTISAAVAVNIALYGLTAPFAAALMERFGVRRVVALALALVAAGSGTTVFMTASWQLVLCWGLLVGLGTGSMAMALVATVVGRWFATRQGLVSGVLTAAGATGQLVFLPVIAVVTERHGWRVASLGVAGVALAVVPLVLLLLRDRPADLGIPPYGGTVLVPSVPSGGAARMALGGLLVGVRSGQFWLLAGGFMICGATTVGLIQPHFVPAAHDHGMPVTAAASLLALVGVFDIVGTIASGWLTDRVDPRWLLLTYYLLRGLSLLLLLPPLLGPTVHPGMLAFVVFYGLDWVATVPPTLALCRSLFGERAPVVFGWIFASHQVGGALMAFAAGVIRDHLHRYDPAWYLGGVLCVLAGGLSLAVRRQVRV